MSMPFDSCLAMHDCGGGNTQTMITNYYFLSLRHVENTYFCILSLIKLEISSDMLLNLTLVLYVETNLSPFSNEDDVSNQYLVFVARTLAVLCDGLKRLYDKVYVPLINVKPQQPQSSRCAATDTVKKLQRLAHQVIIGFVVLIS